MLSVMMLVLIGAVVCVSVVLFRVFIVGDRNSYKPFLRRQLKNSDRDTTAPEHDEAGFDD